MNKRYFIELSYLGTNYHGWQMQPNAITVQQKVNEALETIFQCEIMVTGCGRTDTGVHASQYFAHVDLDLELVNLSEIDLTYKLNLMLPFDIAIHRIFEVTPESHARFDASSRTYEYHINIQKNPFLHELSFRLNVKEPDFSKMNEAAKILFKYKDFECFSKTGTDVNNFNCDIKQAFWEQRKASWVFTIQADRFLRNMVRAIVGTLLEVGLGKMNLEEFKKVIESKNRSNAGYSVPPQGLYLSKIEYPFV